MLAPKEIDVGRVCGLMSKPLGRRAMPLGMLLSAYCICHFQVGTPNSGNTEKQHQVENEAMASNIA